LVLAALLVAAGCKGKGEAHAQSAPSLAMSDGPVVVPEAVAQPDGAPAAPVVEQQSTPTADAGPVAKEKKEPEEKLEDELDDSELKGPLPKGVTRDKVLGGLHWRFHTGAGTVNVWMPPGYHAKNAGIVVYVHGYGGVGYPSSSDQSWRDYKLAEQFKESRQNAIFIVPDAPTANEDPVKYTKLSTLLRAVWSHTHIKRPKGALVVIGHSGAFRTIVDWLDYRPIAHVILLDALFGYENNFSGWLEKVKGHENHKLTMVGQRTAPAAEVFLQKFQKGSVVRLNSIPGKFAQMPKRARTARILYIRSQYGHMELVTSHKVIPVMLRRTPLKPI
jgi:hypothetical protein